MQIPYSCIRKNRAERIEDGFILTKDDVILEAGPYTKQTGENLLKKFRNSVNIIGSDKRPSQITEADIPRLNTVMLPAFVKAHGHDHEQPLIGIAKDLPLTEWLDKAVNPFTGFLNSRRESLKKDLGISPQLLIYYMARICDINYGITSSMVHHCNYNKYYASELAKANEDAGTDMIIALGSQDRYYYKELLDSPGEAVKRLDKTLEIKDLKKTSFCPGPDQLFSNSRELLIPLKKWAEENNTLFHIHSSEEAATTAWFKKEIEPGMTPVQYASSIGILDKDTVLAHQVNSTQKDIEILAETGAKIVHNPLANTILGSGMPPLIEMLDAGIPVAVSTDGSGSADNQNIMQRQERRPVSEAFHQDASLLKSENSLK